MATIEISRNHSLSAEDVKNRAHEAATRIEQKYGAKATWNGDVCDIKGPGVTATLTVGASDVRIAVDLGFLLRPMKGKIQERIERELERSFGNPVTTPPVNA